MKKSIEEESFINAMQHTPTAHRNILLYFFRLHREATTKKGKENAEQYSIRRDNELDIVKAEIKKYDKDIGIYFWKIIQENGVLPLDSEWTV